MRKGWQVFSAHSLGGVYFLMAVQGVCFVAAGLGALFSGGNLSPFTRWFLLSADASQLLTHPWQLLTYGFFHLRLMHWLLNMVLLYFTGVIFMNLLSPKRFLSLYMAGIVVGGLAFVFVGAMFPEAWGRGGLLVGASAGIMAPLIFLSAYVPTYQIHLFGVWRLPLWVLGVALVVVDMASLPMANGGGHMAHLAGAVLGLGYALYLKGTFSLTYVKGFLPKKKAPTLRQRQPLTEQERIDAMLDKINRGGYDSLTRKEREQLFKYSKKL